jgi:transcriptional regulator with XRE-family HTH domain
VIATGIPTEKRSDGLFAQRIKRLRTMQGKSQRQVAELAGVTDRTYRAWESGTRVPYFGPNLESIATVRRAPPLFLLYGEGEHSAFD